MRPTAFIYTVLTACLLCFFQFSGFAEEGNEDLESEFRQDKLWSGGDGSYSIALPGGLALWLFGDSFIGTIDSGTREGNQMVHNAVAIQNIEKHTMSFYWNRQNKAGSYFPDGKDYWYWPGDGVFLNGKVYCFAKKTGMIKGKEDDPFGFVWLQDELVVIDNPLESPDNWQCRHVPVPFSNKQIHIGTACLADSGYLYILGQKETARAFLARLSVNHLENLELDSFEFLASSKGGKTFWVKDPKAASIIWQQAAAEASLSKIHGSYLCLYHKNGLGAEVVVRTAKSIEGPWSDEKLVYTIPEKQCKRGFTYAAKAHPEQLSDKNLLAITYAINPGDLKAHNKDPLAYFPKVAFIKSPVVSDKSEASSSNSGNN